MTNIKLTEEKDGSFRAVIDWTGTGRATFRSRYTKYGKMFMEAKVERDGQPGWATFRFWFDGEHWVTDSDPLDQSEL